MRAITLLPISLGLLLAGCVVPTGPVEVTRYNRVSEGVAYGKGTYTLSLSGNARDSDTLSVSSSLAAPYLAAPYLAAVARELQAIGYTDTKAPSDVIADIVLATNTRTPPKQSPVSVGVGGSTGSYGSGVGLGIGINLGGGPKAQVETTLSVKIRRRTDNLVIWEGSAVQSAAAKSPAAQPGIAASKLAAALFQGFPGTSGETIQVK